MGSLELDRLGGLIRRCRGRAAATFSSARSRSPVSHRSTDSRRVGQRSNRSSGCDVRRDHRRHRGCARARGARRDSGARRAVLGQGRRARCSAPPRRGVVVHAEEAPVPIGSPSSAFQRGAWSSGLPRGSVRLARRACALGGHADDGRPGASQGRGTASERAGSRWSSRGRRRARRASGAASGGAAPTWACGQRVERSLDWTAPGPRSRCGSCSDVLRPEREIVVRAEGGTTSRRSPTGTRSRTCSRTVSTDPSRPWRCEAPTTHDGHSDGSERTSAMWSRSSSSFLPPRSWG